MKNLCKKSQMMKMYCSLTQYILNTMAAYGWTKRGQKRPLQTNFGRHRLNLHGAINAETLDMTVIESQAVDAESTITLLETLIQKYPFAPPS